MDEPSRQRYVDRVRALAGLGHRGSGTSLEARAAGYIARQWAASGLEPRLQPFDGARSLGQRIGVHVLVALVGALLLWSHPLVGGLLGLAALISVGLEHTWGIPVLGRFLIGAPSQNVVATVPARSGVPRRRVVLVGHYFGTRSGNPLTRIESAGRPLILEHLICWAP